MTSILQGKKTYIAAIGLVGLAVFQFSTGDLAGGVQSLLAAATAFGLRDAVARQEAQVLHQVQAVRDVQAAQGAILQAVRPPGPPPILRTNDY